MKTIEIFGREGCAKCKTTKSKVKFLLDKWKLTKEIKVIYCDLGTVDGLAESAYYNITETPSVILREKDELFRVWKGELLKSEELKEALGLKF